MADPCGLRTYRTWRAAQMALYREQEETGQRKRHRGLIQYCLTCFGFHIPDPADPARKWRR